jgi:hypothetical protein
MTPAQISMVAELDAAPPVPEAPASTGGGTPSFEQLLVARAKDMFTRQKPPAGQSNASIVESPSSFGDILNQPRNAPGSYAQTLAGRQRLLARFARLARYAVGQGAHDYRLCPHNGLSVQGL